PASCTRTRTARPRMAMARLMPHPYLRARGQRHQLAGAAVGVDEVSEVACRRAVDPRKDVLDRSGDVEEADPLVEERLNGDLVGRVVGTRVRPALLAGVARECEQPECLDVRLVELERLQLERRHRRLRTLR